MKKRSHHKPVTIAQKVDYCTRGIALLLNRARRTHHESDAQTDEIEQAIERHLAEHEAQLAQEQSIQRMAKRIGTPPKKRASKKT